MESFEDLDTSTDSTYESFDDLDSNPQDGEDVEVQGMGSDNDSFDDEEPSYKKRDVNRGEKKGKSAKSETNELEILDTVEDKEVEETPKKKESKEEVKEEEDEVKEKLEDEDKPKKGKPVYVQLDGETFSMDSESLITVPVDGKKVQVPLSELTREYSGKEAWSKRFNELNLKNQEISKKEKQIEETNNYYNGLKEKVVSVIQDPQADPTDAFKIFLDAIGVDSYDIMERQFSHNLEELYKVLTMSEEGQRAYFAEKKAKHLAEKNQRRDEELQRSQRTNSYRQKVDQLRNSFGVSESDYVDAYEELQGFGYEAKDLTENDIVEWAATKPHRQTVKSLLQPYSEFMGDETYADLQWKLAQVLLKKQDTPEGIKRSLDQVYGKQAEASSLKSKLKPIGRPKTTTAPKVTPKKYEFESFEDLED